MSGLQHLRKRQSGKQFIKLTVLMLIVCTSLFGCADSIASVLPGPGRDDWAIQLSNQYYIVKVNSRCKRISKATDSSGVYEDVLRCFYATKYCVSDPFIAFEGIPTKGNFASEEELSSDNCQYYLLDIRDGNLYGPYDTDSAMLESEIIQAIDMSLIWEIVP